MMKTEEAFEVLKDAICPTGNRHIVVLDKGFIFVGDLSKEGDTYTLCNCGNIRKWGKGGFGGLTRSRSDSEAIVDDCATIKFTDKSLIFIVPVKENW